MSEEKEIDVVKEVKGRFKGFKRRDKIIVICLVLCLFISLGFMFGYKTGTNISQEHYLKIIDSGEYCKINGLINNQYDDYWNEKEEGFNEVKGLLDELLVK